MGIPWVVQVGGRHTVMKFFFAVLAGQRWGSSARDLSCPRMGKGTISKRSGFETAFFFVCYKFKFKMGVAEKGASNLVSHQVVVKWGRGHLHPRPARLLLTFSFPYCSSQLDVLVVENERLRDELALTQHQLAEATDQLMEEPRPEPAFLAKLSALHSTNRFLHDMAGVLRALLDRSALHLPLWSLGPSQRPSGQAQNINSILVIIIAIILTPPGFSCEVLFCGVVAAMEHIFQGSYNPWPF